MSTTHLIAGPPGADRAAPLLAAFREAHAAGLGAAVWLAPTRRHADEVRAALPTTVAPQVFDVQAFADELVRTHDPALRPLPDADRRVLLEAALADLRDANDLPYFGPVADTRGFADAAAGYVAELKRGGVDLRALLKATGGRRTAETDRHAQAVKVYDRYQRRLGKLHRLDPDDRLIRAARLWAEGDRDPFPGVRAVFADGFATLTPAARALFDALRFTASDFWLGLTDDPDDPRAEAFAGPRGLRAWATSAVGEASLFNPAPEVVEERAETGALGWLAAGLFRDAAPATQGLHPGLLAVVPSGLKTEAPKGRKPIAQGVNPGYAVHRIEAPGAVGEARLVARRVRELLAAGTPPERILVVPRRLDPAAEVWREVFDEYAVPHEVEGADALARVPAVAFLLKAWRLPDDGWAFPQVAAVLRSTYFRPAWPEVRTDPEVPAKTEALLRMLGEPRGRDAFLNAVAAWAEAPPDPLEDEAGEEPKRVRKHRLAVRCRPFANRYFRAWDRLKPTAPAEAFVSWLKGFAAEVGLTPAAGLGTADADGLSRLWAALDRWARTEAGARRGVSHAAFGRVLAAVAAAPARARTPRGGRVRVLSAERAAGLGCDHLFLVGLGEGSWPNLSAPPSLLDDPERDRLRKAGLPLPDPAARLGAEQLLFLELVSAPRVGLTLSHAAVDERGQPLLPSSFLREVLACFPPDAVPVTRQRMPVEGYFTCDPLSAAELRVQAAASVGRAVPDEGGSVSGTARPTEALPPDLADNLDAARRAADARFRSREFGPFDGELRHPAALAELARRFGPERVFSPTALETYVACPFRFWLEHVLRLEPLDDPAEEVEHTRRGSAAHRALARFHRWVAENVPGAAASAELPAAVSDELVAQVSRAAEEYALRAAGAATRELWRLEGQRLARSLSRYRGQWEDFRGPWREKGVSPVPHSFEADFGVPGGAAADPLVIRVGEIEVRIGGRIDRVDVADLGAAAGFWVIDYKTGRAANYTAAQVERFEKLQLPLYALAVERVLLKDRPARPLGLAYWLVTDAGPKPVLPSGKKQLLTWFTDPARWPAVVAQLEAWVAELVRHVRAGDFPLAPRSDYCTETCAFGPVCRIAQARHTGKVVPLGLPSPGVRSQESGDRRQETGDGPAGICSPGRGDRV